MNKTDNILIEVIADAVSTFLIEELTAIDLDLQSERTTEAITIALDIVKQRKEWVITENKQLELTLEHRN